MVIPQIEERKLRFDARRLAIDSFVRIYLESVQGARQLVMGHLRLMFTLSLGALAGVITLYASALRMGGPEVHQLPWQPVSLALIALLCLVASALLSAATLQHAARGVSALVRHPFPASDEDIRRLFTDAEDDESRILARIVGVLEDRIGQEPVTEIRTGACTALLVLGVVASGLSFIA